MITIYPPLLHLIQLFVLPEIKKRIENGSITQDQLPIEISHFRAYQFKNTEHKISSVVELNQEVNLVIRTKLRKRKLTKELIGQTVSLDELCIDECFILPPKHNGRPCAYFYFSRIFLNPWLVFDLRPNVPGISEEELNELKLKYPIKEFIRERDVIKFIKPIEKMDILMKNNWPPAPGYHPQVFLEMHKEDSIVNSDDFSKIVSNSFNQSYWNNQINLWEQLNLFPKRITYIKKAIQAHFDGDYIASIYILCPQFEGIIRDYLIGNNQKVGKYKGNISTLKELLYSRKIIINPKKILDMVFEYLKEGSFLQRAGEIESPTKMINRPGILHGIFTGFECEELSLKFLILLDSLSFTLLSDKMVSQE